MGTEFGPTAQFAINEPCAGCGSTEGHGRYDCGDDDDVIVVAPWPTAENDYSVTGGLDPHDETLDMQGVPEWLDLIEARVHKDFSSQAGVQSHHDYARMTRDQIQRIYN